MESKKVFTRAMLQEECGITNVTESYFEREVHKVRANKDFKIITYPTLCVQKTKDKERVHYISLTTSIYNYKTGKYVTLPFHKLRWIWQFGEIEMGKVLDHIDTNPLNNDLSNLRLVDEQDNRANKKCWKQFTLEEVKDKSVDELREMIAQRIEEYKDNPYKVVYKKQDTSTRKKSQHTKEYIESKIAKLNEQINDLYDNCYHRPDYIAEKVLKLRNQIEELKNQL